MKFLLAVFGWIHGLMALLFACAALVLIGGAVFPLFGALVERVLIRPVQGASVDLAIVITLGLLLFLIGLANVIWKPTETRVLPEQGAARTFRPDWLFDYERAGDEVRRRYRLQCQGDAQLPDHVGLIGEIEIGLHRAGPVHHVEAARADLRHVGAHDVVARFGHALDFGDGAGPGGGASARGRVRPGR